MQLPLAWLGVILIWSTTPLAIKWSGAGAGVWFAVASRMVIGLALCLLLLALLRRALPWDAGARQTYLAGGLGVFGAMSATYWAAQFIPSGLVAVMFGLTPLATGVLAALWLGERALTPLRLVGLTAALAGLALVFLPGLPAVGAVSNPDLLLGSAGMLVAVLVHSTSAVWIKRIHAPVGALATTTGALLVSVPLFTLMWLVLDGTWPLPLDPRTTWSILYLAVAGSTLAFALYYYLLRRLSASRVALITLLTPVLSLALGHLLNGEALDARVLAGSTLILAGLAVWLWGDQWRARARRWRRTPPTEPPPSP